MAWCCEVVHRMCHHHPHSRKHNNNDRHLPNYLLSIFPFFTPFVEMNHENLKQRLTIAEKKSTTVEEI